MKKAHTPRLQKALTWPENPKRSQGIRARRTTDGVIELWLGEPGEAESECFMQVHELFLPGILHTLENIYKSPVVESNMVYGRRPS